MAVRTSVPSTRASRRGLPRFTFGALDAAARPRWCRFIDVWDDGAALELYGLGAHERPHQQLRLEVGDLAPGRSLTTLHGVLTRGVRTETGRVIVLLRFWALTYEQRRLVRSLVDVRPYTRDA